MIPPSRFSPSPCRSQEVANSCLSSVWSQGLTQGLSDHSVKFCTWKVMCCVLVKTMISTRRLPPNNETCRIWFTLTGILWRWQLVVGLFGRQNHRALQCSCYFSQGHQRAVCSCLRQTHQSNPKVALSKLAFLRTCFINLQYFFQIYPFSSSKLFWS